MLCMGDNWLLKLFVSKGLRRGMTSNLSRDMDNLRSDVKPLRILRDHEGFNSSQYSQ